MTSVPRRPGPPAAEVLRFSAVSAGALGATVLAHKASGGTTTALCAALPGLLVLASVVTGAASWCAHRTRGPWAALATLALGQLGMTLALALPAMSHVPIWTVPSALVHAAALPALAATVLGLDRVGAEVAQLLDRVAPRVRAIWIVSPPRASTSTLRAEARVAAGTATASPCTLRGPPPITAC